MYRVLLLLLFAWEQGRNKAKKRQGLSRVIYNAWAGLWTPVWGPWVQTAVLYLDYLLLTCSYVISLYSQVQCHCFLYQRISYYLYLLKNKRNTDSTIQCVGIIHLIYIIIQAVFICFRHDLTIIVYFKNIFVCLFELYTSKTTTLS